MQRSGRALQENFRAARRVNIKLGSFHGLTIRRRRRQRQFVMDRPGMIRQHLGRILWRIVGIQRPMPHRFSE